jgi:ASC-1-like (ASCH) protein
MNLFLHVRKEYFDQIKSGEKKEEYRLIKPYWIKHKEFGDYLVQVFVIKLQREEEQQAGESK